ncbi:MAG: chemotaxis protein CheA [Planctomycetes bacterium]|nr:chemotaxis protein CheA [Planctomycetota bacterium]
MEEQSAPSLTITPEMVGAFVSEAKELFIQIESALMSLDTNPSDINIVNEAFRAVHSLKGNAGLFHLEQIEMVSHAIETILDDLRCAKSIANVTIINIILGAIDALKAAVVTLGEGGEPEVQGYGELCEVLKGLLNQQNESDPQAGEEALDTSPLIPEELAQDSPVKGALQDNSVKGSRQGSPVKAAPQDNSVKGPRRDSPVKAAPQDIRVEIKKLDLMINLLGELLIADAMISQNPKISLLDDTNLNQAATYLHRIVSDLQDVAMSVRMVPVENLFQKMIRISHDLSRKGGKLIKLMMSGQSTELDRSVLDKLSDPLIHMIRNAVDHGIEDSDVREEMGKDKCGHIHLSAEQRGNEIIIILEDDGAGLDKDKILKKAIDVGLFKETDAPTHTDDIYPLIFCPGFSTAEKVSDVSGRGVGMDVVKRNLESVHGRVSISSELGQGTRFELSIPLTLAILEGMLVRVGHSKFTIPVSSIRESLRPDAEQIHMRPDGQEMIKLRKEILPVVRLHQKFNIPPDKSQLESGVILVLSADGQHFCLFVDEILHQHETVIKELTGHVAGIKSLTGCNILGDGQVALIINVEGLYRSLKEAS